MQHVSKLKSCATNGLIFKTQYDCKTMFLSSLKSRHQLLFIHGFAKLT